MEACKKPLKIHPGGEVDLDLPRGRMVALNKGAGTTVACVWGSLWITQDNDIADIVLGPGDSFRVDRDGLALLSAMHESKVVIAAPSPRAMLQFHAGISPNHTGNTRT